MTLDPGPRFLLLLAIVLVVLALAWQFLPLRPGRLPGDFAWGRGNVRLHFPLATSLLVSAVLTLLLWLFGKLGK